MYRKQLPKKLVCGLVVSHVPWASSHGQLSKLKRKRVLTDCSSRENMFLFRDKHAPKWSVAWNVFCHFVDAWLFHWQEVVKRIEIKFVASTSQFDSCFNSTDTLTLYTWNILVTDIYSSYCFSMMWWWNICIKFYSKLLKCNLRKNHTIFLISWQIFTLS